MWTSLWYTPVFTAFICIVSNFIPQTSPTALSKQHIKLACYYHVLLVLIDLRAGMNFWRHITPLLVLGTHRWAGQMSPPKYIARLCVSPALWTAYRSLGGHIFDISLGFHCAPSIKNDLPLLFHGKVIKIFFLQLL